MEEKMTLTSKLENMKPGEMLEFPPIKLNSVKVAASTIGFKLDRKYQTKTDRDRRILTVTRIK